MSLTLSNIRARVMGKEILRGISFTVGSGEVHAVMGPNGSGKSTLAYAIMGHPNVHVKPAVSKILLNNKNITGLSTEERAKRGLFLALQSPIAVPGVSVVELLRTAYREQHTAGRSQRDRMHNPLLAPRWKAGGMSILEFTAMVKRYAKALHIDESFLSRGIHDGFSGGEKKKIEMLTALVLSPKFAVLDEIDTGLDIDALKIVAGGIRELVKKGTGVIIITHFRRILKYIEPDVVHVLVNGTIVKTGKAELAGILEEKGYEEYR